MVSASTDGQVLVWRVPSERAANGSPISSVRAIVCDADRVWVGGADGSVSCLDGATGKPLSAPFFVHEGSVTAAVTATVQQEPVLVTGGSDGRIATLSRRSGRPVKGSWAGDGRPVLALAAGDGNANPVAVIDAGPDTVEVWDLSARTRLCVLGRQADACASAVAVVSGRPWVVRGSSRGVVSIWEVGAGRHATITRPVAVLGHHAGPVTTVAATTLGSQLMVVSGATDRTAMRWTMDAGRRGARAWPDRGPAGSDDGRHILQVNGSVTAVVGNPDGTLLPLSVVAADGAVHIWGAAGRLLRIQLDERVTAVGWAGAAVVVGTDRGIAAFAVPTVAAGWAPGGERVVR